MLTFNFVFVTIISVIFCFDEDSGFSKGKNNDLQNMTWKQFQNKLFYVSSQMTVNDATINSKESYRGEVEPSWNKTLEEVEKAFTKKNKNESVERIQSVKSGLLMKSTFIPLVSNDVSQNISEGNKLLEEDNRHPNKNSNVLETSKNFRSEERSAVNNQPINLNNTLILKNGKFYKVFKVKKNPKRNEDISNRQNHHMQRTFKFLPNLLSILPIQWMTKETKNETLDLESKIENQTSSPQFFQIAGNNSSESFNHSLQSSEKIKKLLNLFTIVTFDNAECYADGVKGNCFHQSECETRGGKFSATCARELGVCCYNEKTCGQKSNEKFTYFVSEGFPESSLTTSQVCMLSVDKADPDVVQLRLDFISFQLREPLNGTCLHDRLVVTGQDTNHLVPEICGVNTGQHIYVDVEDTVGPYHLNLITMGEYYPRNFRIKVTQLKKSDKSLSPKNCLQYFTEPFGTIQTFNYQQNIVDNLDEIYSGYFNNLNYAICIKRLKGFCSISYENEESESLQPSFQLVNVDLEGEKLLPPRQAGAETFDCPDDYIVINGIRLCGEKLNDASVEIDFTKNYPVTDTSNGPFIINVRTDAAVSGRGFSLKYYQNPCLV